MAPTESSIQTEPRGVDVSNGLTAPAAAAVFPPLTQPTVTPASGLTGAAASGELKWGILPLLIGNWVNQPAPNASGFNVMPLPDASSPTGYILKNFEYYEQLTIDALAANPTSVGGSAANRGAVVGGLQYEQNCFPLFYAQRVYITGLTGADAPNNNTNIHAENGSWLHLVADAQPDGRYGPPSGTNDPFPTGATQPAAASYAKQMSVPHGNSILAIGGATSGTGMPTYPSADPTMPPYNVPIAPRDPNDGLRKYAKTLDITRWDAITVSTEAPGGGVTNIPFEIGHADVVKYETTIYVLQASNSKNVLQYSQTIFMNMLIQPGGKPQQQVFQHITAASMLGDSGPAPAS